MNEFTVGAKMRFSPTANTQFNTIFQIWLIASNVKRAFPDSPREGSIIVQLNWTPSSEILNSLF
jgi:hypothetical protein